MNTSTQRIPFTNWLSPTLKTHFVATTSELFGTFLFLFFAFGTTQVALTQSLSRDRGGVTDTSDNKEAGSDPSQLLYIALGFGFSLTVNAWVFFRCVLKKINRSSSTIVDFVIKKRRMWIADWCFWRPG
jgi:glycerol uptake facilitator-like aquaporin